MAIELNLLSAQSAATTYAKFLRALHQLIREGKEDSEQAETLADQMDVSWRAMTDKEQSRMRGLASDLHVLREGGTKRVSMTKEQLAAWKSELSEAWSFSESGTSDPALNFLRQPVPSHLPLEFIPFLQARCWEKLGDLETALEFMKEAERLNPEDSISVLLLLQQLGRFDELSLYAERVFESRRSSPQELYLAATALLNPTRIMSDAEARPILQKVVPVFERALTEFLALPATEKAECSDTDAQIAQALGLCFERLGEPRAALAVFDRAIQRHPRDAELVMARGLAHYWTDTPKALQDFRKAVSLGVSAIWPYLLLAKNALQNGAPMQAVRLASEAQHQPGPSSARAEAFETMAIALEALGQPRESVLEKFDIAIGLDPENQRIRENRAIAVALTSQEGTARSKRPQHQLAPPITPEGIRRARGDLMNRHAEQLSNDPHGQISRELAGVS